MTSLKQPGEKLIFSYDFTDKIGAATIASINSVTNAARSGGTTLTKDAQAIAGSAVNVTWSGGTDAATYITTVKVTDSAGLIHEVDGEIVVADLSFALPVGITSTYLTGEEYVARFGIDETVRLTDQVSSDTVGEALGKALVSAASRIEGYIRSRYELPLASAPEVLKDIAADLARERLFTLHPTEEVTARADRARKDLKDIAAGTLLLVVANQPLSEGAADVPVVDAPASIFTNDVLGAYQGRMRTLQ